MGAICSPTSFFRQPLPDGAPLDPKSGEYVANIVAQKATGGSNFLFGEFALGCFVAGPTVATQKVWLDVADGNQAKKREMLGAVPIPVGTRPPPPYPGDNTVEIWQPSTDKLFALHGARFHGIDATRVVAGCSTLEEPGWHCDDAEAIAEVSKSPGYFVKGQSWPGVEEQWGLSGSRITGYHAVMTPAEAKRGYVGHALRFAVEKSQKGTWRWPAQGTDGTSEDPTAPMHGMILRFPAGYDVDSKVTDPLLRTICTAGRDFGFVITDSTGAGQGIAWKGATEATRQGTQALGTDAWKGPEGKYGGIGALLSEGPVPLFKKIPVQDLVVVDASYRPSAVTRKGLL